MAERKPEISFKTAILHNRVLIEKRRGEGSDGHAQALFVLAKEIADNPEAIQATKAEGNGNL